MKVTLSFEKKNLQNIFFHFVFSQFLVYLKLLDDHEAEKTI